MEKSKHTTTELPEPIYDEVKDNRNDTTKAGYETHIRVGIVTAGIEAFDNKENRAYVNVPTFVVFDKNKMKPDPKT